MDSYIINPNTGKRIKVGGRVYQGLVKSGVIKGGEGDWNRRGRHMAGMYEDGGRRDWEDWEGDEQGDNMAGMYEAEVIKLGAVG